MTETTTEVPGGTTSSEQLTYEELALAARNHGHPLEALRQDVSPAGLHYLLVHYDIPVVDPQAWRLTIDGHVRQPLRLSLADLRARPAATQQIMMECAGTGRARLSPRPLSQPWLHEAIGNAEWTGTPLAALLEEAGLRDDTVDVVFTGLDRGVEGGQEQSYARSLSVADCRRSGALLAYAMNGAPLPAQHGFPLRLLVPRWYGMTCVKWLGTITAITQPFRGYQQTKAYRFRQQPDDEGEPVRLIAVRSLMVPPGIPEFLSRRRICELGPIELVGRAWSGSGPVEQVEVSTDGGGSWQRAHTDRPPSPSAWQAWSFRWHPDAPGEYELCCRATDAAGHVQPLEAAWNLGGYAVNSVQRIPVTVR